MGFVFFYCNALISWHSKLHSYVTTSTNHTEYVCSAKAAREARYLQKIFHGIGLQSAVSPIDLYCDNSGAVAMNLNPVKHDASKHVDIADHYARELVERGLITMTLVGTKDMLADFLTKQLTREHSRDQHTRCGVQYSIPKSLRDKHQSI